MLRNVATKAGTVVFDKTYTQATVPFSKTDNYHDADVQTR